MFMTNLNYASAIMETNRPIVHSIEKDIDLEASISPSKFSKANGTDGAHMARANCVVWNICE